jgi:hypothetical protein
MGKPKNQFSRPSINLDTGVKKDWREVEVQELVRGDNVRGHGVIEWIEWNDFGDFCTVTWKSGKQTLFSQFDTVTAFTAVV